jgi:4-diphosphocytidyl-2-C-methyl-D-erythritol kinase
MNAEPAHAKLNLALAVGPVRADGLHELVTLYQRLELADTIAVEPADELSIRGFAEDTLVRRALERLAAAAGVEPGWHVRIDKRIPVAAGLGGGSSDAATALRVANGQLGDPLDGAALHEIAASLGADVPFFLAEGPQLGTGTGTTLAPVDLPQGYIVLLVLPQGVEKRSTAEVYAGFDGEDGFDDRRNAIVELASSGRSTDLALLPPNDLARSPLSGRLRELGAFRADVTGAGPTVYGLFEDRAAAEAAAATVAGLGESWLGMPAW